MLIDEAFCSFVLNELKRGEMFSLTWALALAQAGGNEHQAQALYVKLRVDELRRRWESAPLAKIPEGLAFGPDSVFHKGMLIPYDDIVAVTLYSNFTQWQTGYRIRDTVTTSRSFLFRLATQYHVIEFSKLCLFAVNSQDYEALFMTFTRLADETIIPRIAKQYVHRLTRLGEPVSIADITIDRNDGIRSKTLGFRTHLPPGKFASCERDYFSASVSINKVDRLRWKEISCKEPNAVVIPPVLMAIWGKS